jgi:chromosome segregation ATPase
MGTAIVRMTGQPSPSLAVARFARRGGSSKWSLKRRLQAFRGSTNQAHADAYTMSLERRLKLMLVERRTMRKKKETLEQELYESQLRVGELEVSMAELQKKAQADHEKLLAARKEKREALKTAGWHRSRDKTMASLKASMRALEEHHTALAARLAARDKVDPVVINDLKSQLSSAQATLEQIPRLQRVTGGKEMKGGRKYPDWFYMTAHHRGDRDYSDEDPHTAPHFPEDLA